ncbi:hypothetical protein NNJEOMEG_03821 [Fundidesulfovibrio magnetotacticus]|uniref:DUF4384 domain-containing protein n=1 Tax=Fundidesulfovibrio magnetotacticus TaxID=2730080 RepID=A0A6V8M0G0_9BACT|nr:FlgO family outer membrane protein [Fundidesulfovibrio magnetotacticus]GFK95948.1 hypothetical protein NNJEOMEG_03821 [Fundidesulfovibrio magnetotacticus]
MTRRTLAVLLAFLLVLAAAQARAQAGASAPPADQTARAAVSAPRVVAVVPFESLRDRAPSATGRMAAEFVTTALARHPGLTMVERTRVEHVLGEMEFGASQGATGGTAQKLGQMVGADSVVVGAVSEFETELRLDVRLVSVSDGAILATATAQAQRGMESLSRAAESVAAQLAQAAASRQARARASEEDARRGLSVAVLGSRPGATPRMLAPGDALRGGDRYKLVLTPSRDGHAYVFQVDARDNVFQLFPLSGESAGTNPLRTGQPRELPGPGKSFVLDEVKGPERILVFFGPEPDPDLEALTGSLRQALQDRDKAAARKAGEGLKQAARTRGVKGVVEDAQVTARFQGRDAPEGVGGNVFVFGSEKGAYEFTFQHR